MTYRTLLKLLDLETSPGGDEGDGGTGDQDSGGSGSTPPAGTPSSQAGDEAAKKELAAARREAAKYRTERNTLQTRVEELEGASKTEVEKLTDKTTKLAEDNNSLSKTNRALRVRVLAGTVGIADPKAAADAANLLDWDSIKDPNSDDAIEKALRELVQDRPYLLGNVAGGGDGGEGGTSNVSGTTDFNQAIRRAAGITT